MKKIILSAVIPLFFAVGTNSVMAGVRVGNHHTPYAGIALQQGVNDFGTGFKIYGGYEFMDFNLGKNLVVVSAEGAYDYFGKKGSLSNGDVSSGTGFSVVANARMSVLDNLDVSVHAGLANTTVKYKNISGSATQTGLTIGGSASYVITDTFSVFAGVDMYKNTDAGDEAQAMLGGEMRF
ncbi:MAG: hypothetical protein R3240_09750 [Gammaproteobacteria bacterium]|nr:hypothetical protein [Gammaproteobacteria bacterium]